MGVTGPKPRTFPEIEQVLLANTIITDDGCFLWQGHCAGDGYGTISWQGKQTYIHRLVYKQLHKEEPKVIRHTCDNPRCWNTAHLKNGSHADNVNDKVTKGRQIKGDQCHAAKLDNDKVREIKRKLNEGVPVVRLAVEYDVARSQIIHIRDGKSWKHVT